MAKLEIRLQLFREGGEWIAEMETPVIDDRPFAKDCFHEPIGPTDVQEHLTVLKVA